MVAQVISTISTKEHLNLDVIDVDATSLDDIEVDPIKPEVTSLVLEISPSTSNPNEIQVYYKYGNNKGAIIPCVFSSEQEQASIKELIPDCDVDIYFLKDGSVKIGGGNQKLNLSIKTDATIESTAKLTCKTLQLAAKSLLLQNNVTTSEGCALSYTQQLENKGKLTAGTNLNCVGAAAASLTNRGTMFANGNAKFNHNPLNGTTKIINHGLIGAQQDLTIHTKQLYNYNSILSSQNIIGLGKKLFNLGIIFGDKDVKLSYLDHIINSHLGVIASNDALSLIRRDHNKPIDVDELQPTSNLINQGRIIGVNKLDLFDSSGIISNERNSLLKSNSIIVGGKQFINDGNIVGDQKLEIILSHLDGYWYNKSMGEVHTKNLHFVLDKLVNEGNIHAQQELNSLLTTLKNQLQGQILSDVKMRLTAFEQIINDCLIKAREELTLYSKSTIINEFGQFISNKILFGGEHVANDGEIIANKNSSIITTLFNNLANGKIISAEQLQLAVEEQLNNQGTIQAKTANISSANQIVNSESGLISSEQLNLIAAKTENAGEMIASKRVDLKAIYNFNQTATGSIIANITKVAGAEINLSGQLLAKQLAELQGINIAVNQDGVVASEEDVSIDSGNLGNKGSITAEKQLQADVYNKIEQTTSGSMVGSEVVVKSNSTVNDGIISASTNLSLTSNILKNLYNATIESASTMAITVGQLQNAGTVKAYGELTLKLLCCLENLQSGNINSIQKLIIDVCGSIKNSGLISSESQALIKIGDALENYNTGVIRAKEFNLSGGWKIDNFGVLLGSEQLKLTTNVINNFQSGKISSQQALDVISGNLHNYGSINSEHNLRLSIQNILQNYQSSNISAIDALNLVGAKLIVNAGEITSLQNIDMNAIEALENLQSGKITASQGLTTIAELFVENYGKLAAHQIKLAATNLLLNGQLHSDKLVGNAEIITSNGDIDGGATDLTADLVQIDGKLNATTLNIEAKNYLHLLKSGEITCTDAAKLLTKAGFVNLGKILSKDKLSIIAKELFHDKTASIDARHDLYLKAVNLYLDGDLKASKDLFVLVENQFEYKTANLTASGELTLTLADGTQVKHNINTPGSLKIEFLTKDGTWYNEQQLIAGNNLTLDISGFIFVNGKSSNEALLQAKNTLKIDAGQVDTGLGTLKATDLGIHTQSDITVNKDSKIEIASGVFHSEEGSIDQQAELTAKKGITLLASKKYGQPERAALNTSMMPQYNVASNYDPIIYKLSSSNEQPKYFEAIAVSGADGACALAAIYKIVGSKEVGWQARIKAVQQLKESIDDPVVKDLIRSELRGALLSDQDLYELESIGLPISSDEVLAIGYFKATRLMLIEEGERLKIKYFSDHDLPISGTNKSYAKLFLDGDLDEYCEITEAEKAKLQILVERVDDVNLAIEQLVDDKILDYVNYVVGKSGFWLGVASNSPGVMGAVAKINKVNFKILTDNGSQDASSNSPEVISICEHVSVPDAKVHNIYLRATVGDVPGVQENSSHFELLKETSDPALNRSTSEAKKARSKINISGKIKAGNVAVVADGKVTGISQIEADVDALIGSLCDDVEIKSIRARRGNNENFDDYIISQARVAAKNMLQISAGGNIIFHGVETASGEGGTRLQALANVLELPIDLLSQRVQHFYEKKKSGTIRDTYFTQHASSHKTTGDFSSRAGGSSVFYSHSIDAKTATITSVGATNVLNTTSGHEHVEDLRGKRRRWHGGSKKISSYCASVSSKSVGTKFNVAKELRISGADVTLRHIHSTAARNIFSASGGKVSILQGENRFGSIRVKSSSDALWRKSSSESRQRTTYSESTFTGTIEIESQSAVIEVVSGRVLSFLEQIITKPEDLTYKTLIEHYERHAESSEGPGAGIVAIVAVVTAILTQGTAAGWAASLLSGAAEGVAHAALTAGLQGLCAQAASSMVANNGDFSKTLKELVSTDTVKKLAISMISAGVMDKIGSTLKLPTDAKLRSMPQRVTNHVAKANIDAGLNMGICNKKAEAALKDSFINAAFAIVGSKVDAMHELNGLSSITSGEHTMLHAMLGGVRGTAVRGQHGWLCGAVEGVVSAKLPAYIEKLKAQKAELKQQQQQQDSTAKENLDKAEQERLRQKILLQEKKVELIGIIEDKLKLLAAVEAQNGRGFNLPGAIEEICKTVHHMNTAQLNELEKTFIASFDVTDSFTRAEVRQAGFEKPLDTTTSEPINRGRTGRYWIEPEIKSPFSTDAPPSKQTVAVSSPKLRVEEQSTNQSSSSTTSLLQSDELVAHRQVNNIRWLKKLEMFSRGLDHFTSQEQASSSWRNNDFDLDAMLYSAQSKVILNSYQQYQVGTRAMGAMQAGFGIGQLGLSVALAETGVGIAPACFLAARGADNLVTGAMGFVTGQDRPTVLHQAVRGIGLSDTAAMWVEFGVDLSPIAPAMVRNASHIAGKGMLKLYDVSVAKNLKWFEPQYVSTGGFRNELPLTLSQKQEALDYAISLGMPKESIVFVENSNTGYKLFFGDTERLQIGTDLMPTISKTSIANSRVTMRGAIAHEIVGHRAAELANMTQSNAVLEEAQASIRAARFAEGLTDIERTILLRDGVERLRNAGYKVADVKHELWIHASEALKPQLTPK